MQAIKEIYQTMTTQPQKHWRRCRVLKAEDVYRDFIKRFEMYCFPEKLILEPEFKEIIGQVSLWYANDERFKQNLTKGLLLRGNCGTGKTMITETLSDVIEYGDRKKPLLINARDLQMLYINNKVDEIDSLKKRFLVIIDDLGVENSDIRNYGNVLEPFNDLFDYRYRNRMETIITSNLPPELIKERYGDRILDRFKETMNDYVFTFKSYRK